VPPGTVDGWAVLMKRTEDGFTLIELLVAIVIMGIITVPLGDAFIGYLRNTGATSARLAESHDAQIAAAYWAQDVVSIGARAAASPYGLVQSVDDTGSVDWPYPCSTGSGAPVVRFVWDDFPGGAGTPTKVRTAYVVQTVGNELQLRRLTCSGSSTPTAVAVLAHDLDPTVAPTVSCSTSCTGPVPVVPQAVTLTLTIKNGQNQGPSYVVTLTGQRRQT
jgi:prepilin-type N-terminal cleavage/methylation domain-containing protein